MEASRVEIMLVTASAWEAVQLLLAFLGVAADIWALRHVGHGLREFPSRTRAGVIRKRRFLVATFLAIHVGSLAFALTGTVTPDVPVNAPMLSFFSNLLRVFTITSLGMLALMHAEAWLNTEEMFPDGETDRE